MDTIFMNSKNSKTCCPHRILLNLIDKIDLRRKDKLFLHQILSNLILLYMEKYKKVI